MKYFSLFTGVGGFEYGIRLAYEHERSRLDSPDKSGTPGGRECDVPLCVGFSEIDRYASDVLRFHYPKTKNYGDITKINWSDVPDFDLLVGGSPCQDLSVAGKQRGLAGERSGLFYAYVNALIQKKPAHFIWENVKGALSSNGGRDFANILTSFSEAGYSLWWQVLNAKDFGVPQNRERVFIVGSRNGSSREILFERNGAENGNTGDKQKQGGQNMGAALTVRNASGNNCRGNYVSPQSQRVHSIDGIASTLNAGGGGAGAKTGLYTIRQPLRFLQRNQKNIEGDYAFTVDASQTSGVNVEGRIRRLTPLECERLMSWPDDHTKYGRKEDGMVYEISDSQRYKMCGNGVVSRVVEEVVRQHLIK